MLRAAAALFLCAAVGGVAAATPATPSRPLVTSVFEPHMTAAGAPVAYARIRAAGATRVRIALRWQSVAPAGARRPAGFAARDHTSRHYRWSAFDEQLRRAVAAGLQPIVNVVGAPTWATESEPHRELGPVRPSPAELGHFARAAATRYSGKTPALPRVRYWQLWNEPNITIYLRPQFEGTTPVAARWYARMLVAFGNAVRAAAPGSVVVAGGLSPFTVDYGDVETVGPLRFMRDLLCLSAAAKPVKTCNRALPFDVWAHHPYTSGGPTRGARHPDDVSLGDLPKMRRLLDAAVRARQIASTRPVEFWVTEFSWDTNRPDPKGVPAQLHARWVAEALHVMWNARVSLATWFKLRDEPYPASPYQSGLYFRGKTLAGDRPKPALAAFRFPFVAYRERSGLRVWGRTPTSKAGVVQIERKPQGAAWRRVATVRADRHGIFRATLPLATRQRDYVRARVAGQPPAVPFSLTRPPDRDVAPFG